MSLRRLSVIAVLIVSGFSFLLSLRLFVNLIVMHLGYGAIVPLPLWIIQRTPVGFHILYSLLGGPLFLVLAVDGIWIVRRYLRRSPDV